MSDLVLCDCIGRGGTLCVGTAVAVSTEGRAESRRARCKEHRILGGELGGDHCGIGRRENDWIRDQALDIDNEVMARIRRANRGCLR